MPRNLIIKNKETGAVLKVKWDGPGNPTDADIESMFTEQKAKNSERMLKVREPEPTGLEQVGRTARDLAINYGENFNWHPIEAAKRIASGVKGVVTGNEHPEVDFPRIASTRDIVGGVMGEVGPPLMAAGSVVAPFATPAVIAGMKGISYGGEKLGEATGANPELMGLGTDVLGLGLAGKVFGGKGRTAEPITPEVMPKTEAPFQPQRLALPPAESRALVPTSRSIIRPEVTDIPFQRPAMQTPIPVRTALPTETTLPEGMSFAKESSEPFTVQRPDVKEVNPFATGGYKVQVPPEPITEEPPITPKVTLPEERISQPEMGERIRPENELAKPKVEVTGPDYTEMKVSSPEVKPIEPKVEEQPKVQEELPAQISPQEAINKQLVELAGGVYKGTKDGVVWFDNKAGSTNGIKEGELSLTKLQEELKKSNERFGTTEKPEVLQPEESIPSLENLREKRKSEGASFIVKDNKTGKEIGAFSTRAEALKKADSLDQEFQTDGRFRATQKGSILEGPKTIDLKVKSSEENLPRTQIKTRKELPVKSPEVVRSGKDLENVPETKQEIKVKNPEEPLINIPEGDKGTIFDESIKLDTPEFKKVVNDYLRLKIGTTEDLISDLQEYRGLTKEQATKLVDRSKKGVKLSSGIDPFEAAENLKNLGSDVKDFVEANAPKVGKGVKALPRIASLYTEQQHQALKDSKAPEARAIASIIPKTEAAMKSNEASWNRKLLTVLKDFTQEERIQVKEKTENPEIQVSPKVQTAVDKLQTLFDQFHSEIKEARDLVGKNFGRLENYIPHILQKIPEGSNLRVGLENLLQELPLGALARIGERTEGGFETEVNRNPETPMGDITSPHVKPRSEEGKINQERDLNNIIPEYVRTMMRVKWMGPNIAKAEKIVNDMPEGREKEAAKSYIRDVTYANHREGITKDIGDLTDAAQKMTARAYLTGSTRLWTLHMARVLNAMQEMPLSYVAHGLMETAKSPLKAIQEVMDKGMIPGREKPFFAMNPWEKFDVTVYRAGNFFDALPDAVAYYGRKKQFLDEGQSEREAEVNALDHAMDDTLRQSPARSIKMFNDASRKAPPLNLILQFRQIQLSMLHQYLRNAYGVLMGEKTGEKISPQERANLFGRTVLATGIGMGGNLLRIATWHLALTSIFNGLYGGGASPFGALIKDIYDTAKRDPKDPKNRGKKAGIEDAVIKTILFLTGTTGIAKQIEKGKPSMIEDEPKVKHPHISNSLRVNAPL